MTSSPEKRWPASARAMRAVQMAFDTSEELARAVRLEAIRQGLSPSDMIREIIELPVAGRPVRPRLTVSLSDNDFKLLAQRYDLPEKDRLSIKKRVMQDIHAFARASKPDE